MVSADKMPPVEAVKEGHAEKDGDSEVAPPSRDNPTMAQGKGTVVAVVGWVPPSSRCCLVSPWARQMSSAPAVLPCASLLLLLCCPNRLSASKNMSSASPASLAAQTYKFLIRTKFLSESVMTQQLPHALSVTQSKFHTDPYLNLITA